MKEILINKKLLRKFKVLASDSKTGLIMLYKLLKKVNQNCALIMDSVVYLYDSKEYFSDLNSLLENLYKKNINIIIIDIKKVCKCNHAVFYNCYSKKEIKKVKENLLVNKEVKKVFLKKRNVITFGKKGNFALCSALENNCFSSLSFKYHYLLYNASIPYIGMSNIYYALGSSALLSLLGYDLIDLIDVLNNIEYKKENTKIVYSYDVSEALKICQKNEVISIINYENISYIDAIKIIKASKTAFINSQDFNENANIVMNTKLAIKKGVKLLKKDTQILLVFGFVLQNNF